MSLEVRERNNDGAEKRYLPRWEVSNRVLFQAPEERAYHSATTRDLSCSGVCITTEDKLNLGQKLKLIIYLADRSPVTLLGQVVWIRPQGGKKIFGVDFLEPDQQIQDTILQYAFELDKDKLVNHWFHGW